MNIASDLIKRISNNDSAYNLNQRFNAGLASNQKLNSVTISHKKGIVCGKSKANDESSKCRK